MPFRDAHTFFKGTWRLVRRIVDRRTGEVGRLDGRAGFTPTPGGAHRALMYGESGLLRIGAYAGEATRRLVYYGEGARLRVTYPDERPFFDIDLETGAAEFLYLCAPDRYAGRVRLHGEDRWSQCWTVTGPRKDQKIMSLYVRMEEGDDRP